MAKSTPQDRSFYYSRVLNQINRWLLMATILLPTLTSLIINPDYISTLNLINFFCMVGYALFTYHINFYLLPKSENIRRIDYFDNTFDFPATQDTSQKYFTNDNIEKGFYKMAVNLFENCFFTSNISEKMLQKVFIKSTIYTSILVYFSYVGFGNNLFANAILQIFLSVIILGELIRLLIYSNKVKEILEQIEDLFRVKKLKNNINKYIPRIIRNYVVYETNISWAGVMLDTNIFNELNPELTKKWNRIKKKYSIK